MNAWFIFSSVMVIGGDTTLRKTFLQIQEGEKRKIPPHHDAKPQASPLKLKSVVPLHAKPRMDGESKQESPQSSAHIVDSINPVSNRKPGCT